MVAVLVGLLALSGCGGAKVPNVVGMRQADAVRTLQEAGYLLGDVSQVATDSVQLGMIAAQEPAAGERAKDGSAVSLAVSFSDGQRVLVPTMVGLTQVTAEGVTALNLAPLFVEQYVADVDSGVVADQVPAPNAEVDAGSTLVMVVSKGKAPDKADVPDVTGKTEADAESALDSAGFSAEVYKAYNSDVAKGKVIAQVPEAGTSALTGSSVQIVVSLGKGTGAVKVPDVTGDSESSAVDAIESAGFTAQKVSQYDAEVAKGKVSVQFPDAGATAAKGSEILIVVSLGAEPADTVAVPNVKGKSPQQATTVLEDAGFTVALQKAPSDTGVGTVVYQFPTANTKVAPGSEVLIVEGVAP